MNPAQRIAVIAPNLPPTRCGVYDYTEKLHEHLPPGTEWTLLCSHKGDGWPGSRSAVIKRDGKSLTAALSELAPDAVLLQYTCYGFAENGVPRWLADGLEAFKNHSSAKLAVMFHELWYSGPIWTRARWRKSGQREVAKRLCACADAVLTGVPLYQVELNKLANRPAIFAPIPSNIEPVKHASHEGAFRVGVFGLPARRERTLKLYASIGKHVAEELLLIGAGLETGLSAPEQKLLASFAPAKILHERGTDPRSVSLALASCHAILSPYASEELSKSGVVMAALAHGCAVIARGPATENGPPFINVTGPVALDAKSQAAEIGKLGRAWYEAHSGWGKALNTWLAALA